MMYGLIKNSYLYIKFILGPLEVPLYIDGDVTIPPNTNVILSHFKKSVSYIPISYFGLITKSALINGLLVDRGVIDSDYRGEVKTCVRNVTNKDIILKKDTSISCVKFIRCYPPSRISCSKLRIINRERGVNGFGSSDAEKKK